MHWHMSRKTYYAILGVSRSESAGGIRAAYRDLAKRLHPDVSGDGTARAFQEVTEAYGVLSDPERRRDYNDALQRADEQKSPLRSRSAAEALVREPLTVLGHPDTIRPSFDAMYERFLRNFTGIEVPKSERLEGLNIEILLTPQEAARGCVLPLCLPAFSPCLPCRGSGRDWVSRCPRCGGQGVIETEERVEVRIPAMTPPGSVVEIALEGLGIHNFFLRLHIFSEA
jgi:molecular chaperone DnaJ